jgi:acetyl-CoA acyltransferase
VVPAVTLDRKCGSAQQAVDFAAQGVIAGAYDVVIAGGIDMMSLVPMRVNRMGKDNEGPLFHQRYPEGLIRQGISAELIAARWSIIAALGSSRLRPPPKPSRLVPVQAVYGNL